MERTKSIEKVDLPDGKYYADWCAYYIDIKLPDWKDISIKVNDGIRGMSRNMVV